MSEKYYPSPGTLEAWKPRDARPFDGTPRWAMGEAGPHPYDAPHCAGYEPRGGCRARTRAARGVPVLGLRLRDHGTAPGVADSGRTITLEEWKRRQ